jgi:hypothetical protein
LNQNGINLIEEIQKYLLFNQKNVKQMTSKLILIIIFIFGSFSFAQQNGSKAAPGDITVTKADTTLQTGQRKKGKDLGNKPLLNSG